MLFSEKGLRRSSGFFFFQAEDGIRAADVTGVQTCALPIWMAVADRNILRLAVYEMLWRDDAPPKVVISEAIEIAKKFGTQESSRFINGILDRVHKELRAAS